VACPFFEPQEILKDPVFARLPLGQAYTGRCLASGTTAQLPLKICNHGYARGRCEHFPPSHDIDAFRFAKSPGGIIWIEEADYLPKRFMPASGIAPDNIAASGQLAAFRKSDLEGRIG
jgi:hypothetical protein